MHNPSPAERIGVVLVRERAASGMTQFAVAERIGVDRSSISRWEMGRREPTLSQVDSVLALYGLRLTLDLEPRPDPGVLWSAEMSRLAALTPAQRLEETGVLLVEFVLALRKNATDVVVDGRLAGWLLGVTDPPRRLSAVITHTTLRQ